MIILKNRSGYFTKNLSGEMMYQSFYPAKLPPDPKIEMDEECINLLIDAHRRLGILQGIGSQIVDEELFVSMYVRKEALLSSQMEGTQATLEDIFDPDIEENVNIDVGEVISYIKASEYAVDRMKTLPLCARFMREMHKILLEGTRGHEKNPGEFRISQNWIGAAGSTIKNARYIPPNPLDMIECIDNLERFINGDNNLDPLIEIALIHYQVETIHPFLDGNGRIGRLLIALYLIEKKLLDRPIIYVSYYLKRNRIEYYDRLMEVRNKGNYEQWIKFFIRAISESAKDAISTIQELSKLHDTNYIKILSVGKKTSNLLELFKYLESHPIIDIGRTADSLKTSYNTMKNMIVVFEEIGILHLAGTAQRNKNYVYKEYLAILKRDTEKI